MGIHLYADSEMKEICENLPKRMSASKIFRCLLVALKTSDEEWEKRLQIDDDLREAKDWLKDKVIGKFKK